MASLDEEITALKAKIEGYELRLNDATITESRYDKLLDLIKSRSENLTELLKLKNAQSAAVNDVDLVANALSGINLAFIDEKDFKSRLGRHSASEFAASGCKPFSGLGLCGHCPLFDPTSVAEDYRPKKLWSYFSISPEMIDENLNGMTLAKFKEILLRSLVVYNDLSKVAKTSRSAHESQVGKDLAVQSNHLDALISICELNLFTTTTSKSGSALKDLNCSYGLASESSTPAGYFRDRRGYIRGIFEVKHGTDIPAEALRQGVSEASNVALMQLNLGVNVDQIMVPVVGSNGHLIQFGAVVMLKPSFPAFFVISNVLDMTNDDSLCEAARLLCCIAMHVATDLEFDRSTLFRSTEEMKVLLDPTLYHMKSLKAFFACTGNIQSSLFHYFKIMSQLHRHPECRDVVLFPICVREYEDSIDHCSIVFPKLGCDYKIGLPDTQEQRQRYFEKLKSAIRAIHTAGVVHLDLYLSNIMWKELESGKIELKIIDWDAAHFITESLFADAQIRIGGRFRAQLHEVAMKDDRVDYFDHKVSMQYYDISLIRALETFADDPALTTRTKEHLDMACIEIQSRYINTAK